MFFPTKKTYIIAEVGANHNGDINIAKKMIDEAKNCGADAVKFQSWDTKLFSKSVYKKNFFLDDDYRSRKDYDLKNIVKKFSLSKKQLFLLKNYCSKKKIQFCTTPFSVEQVKDLEDFKVPFIKIASMDINNPRILKEAALTNLDIILSTGFSSIAEISRAMEYIKKLGNNKVTLLHCIGLYPPPKDTIINLNNIKMLKTAFNVPVGFSDHTLGIEISLASIALGANILEKHFTLDKKMFGWDHHMSCTPQELKMICKGRDRIFNALGSYERIVGNLESKKKKEYRRSIIVISSLKKGTVLTDKHIDFRRPGTGIEPFEWEKVKGRVLNKDLEEEHVLHYKDLT